MNVKAYNRRRNQTRTELGKLLLTITPETPRVMDLIMDLVLRNFGVQCDTPECEEPALKSGKCQKHE